MKVHRSALLCLLAFLPILPWSSPSICQTAPAPAVSALPDVRVDYFGAESGYAVGSSTVVMLCVLRNVGRTPLPANSLRVRCYSLTGLDYTDGELAPIVPALAPGQAAAFRWRLQPTDPTTPLVASVVITVVDAAAAKLPGVSPVMVQNAAAPATKADPPGQTLPSGPRTTLAVVPHLAGALPDVTSGFAAPSALASVNSGRIGNDRVLLRVAPTAGHGVLGALYTKTADGWAAVGIASPIVQIRTSIDGQSPWWRSFRWSQSDAQIERGSATLILYGLCGDDWEAQITFVSHKDSGAFDGKLRLKARRTCRLYAVQLPRLVAAADRIRPIPSADGLPTLVVSNSPLQDTDNLVAAHRGLATCGLAWPSKSPMQDWLALQLPRGDTDHTLQLGAQWSGGERGEVVLPGGIVEFGFRLFCISPSDTVKDAHRFALP